jgi:hypothetical protein
VPESLLDDLRRPTALLDALANDSPGQAWANAASAIRDTSIEVSRLLPEPYGELIDELPNPWVHSLSDVPLELIERDGDLLAYRAALSRCPITPGRAPIANLEATRAQASLPGAGARVVLATPFDEGEAPLDFIMDQAERSFPLATMQTVGSAAALTQVMEAEDTSLLIYLGHGTYDAANEESVLHLRDDTFGTFDVRELDRVPPLVFLIGCSTAGAGSTLGSLAAALLMQGCRGVVATLYPVRQQVAYQFLVSLVRQVAKAPVGPVDLARATLLARRTQRWFSDLTVLVESGRLTSDEAMSLSGDYVAAVGAAPSDPDRANLLAIEARLLASAGVIGSVNSPPASWGIVPYPAFFSVLGLPWTTLKEGLRS